MHAVNVRSLTENPKHMRKYMIAIILMLLIRQVQAQNYFISFVCTGDTTAIETIKVNNLTSGDSVLLNGGDVLHLTGPVGIGAPDIRSGGLQIYPNPVTAQSALTFTTPDNGSVLISLVDLSGRVVDQLTTSLLAGTHSFHISGIGRGFFFLRVNGANYDYAAKLIGQNNLPNAAKIEYVSSATDTKRIPLKNDTATIGMTYTNGDQLIYTARSGGYGTIYPHVPTRSEIVHIKFYSCVDPAGCHYYIVSIGTKVWMGENLKYQTGNTWCYDNNTTNCNTYGRLYDWATAAGACPAGWHLPSDTEWTTLTSFLDEAVAGGKMKETGTDHWLSPNTGATNSSGFTALPGGYRDYTGVFGYLNYWARFWSATAYSPTGAWYRSLDNYNEYVDRFYDNKTAGNSVRCVKN